MLALAHAAFVLRLRPWVRSVITFLDRPARELELLAQLLAVIEREQVTSSLLLQLQDELRSDGACPADHITRLRVIVELLDSRRNMIFAPVAGFLLWTFHLACAAERWRARHGHALATWLAVLGRFEALASLSGYAYEHPADPFPEIEPTGPALIEADGLVHPLLPAAQAVRNDLRLDSEQRVLIISGSNMSGKTTLLRSVGVNLVLAQAGAPVRARRFRFTRCAIGASITTLDSLLEGRSRFFTEIRRCKQIVDLCEQPTPVLFLLDEILHGTNSHERRVGAELLVRGLLERGALGLVTTHDLALAELADTLASLVVNVHFEDRMVDGKLHFDYRLRPGTVTRSNALELMRMIGLVS
jgi:DNA mismatch repair ATPase MutS